MAFGKPTKYWKLDVDKVQGGYEVYDDAILQASDAYVGRMVIFYFILFYFVLLLLFFCCNNLLLIINKARPS